MNTGDYQIAVIRALAFARYGGTKYEYRASEILEQEIQKTGGLATRMSFPVPVTQISACEIRVQAPFEATCEAVPFEQSGTTPPEGLSLKLYYIDRGTEADYVGLPQDLSGCAVLLNEGTRESFTLLYQHKPAAFLVMDGNWFQDSGTKDLVPPRFQDEFMQKNSIPGFLIRTKDAIKLVQQEDVQLHLTLCQSTTEGSSANIIAEITGSQVPEETVLLTAHYDSVQVGTGAWDNASGAANLMYLYQYFLKHKPRRTLRFIWCGSEEQGLLGSRAYASANREMLESVQVCFNFDMCGIAIGHNVIHVTAEADAAQFAEAFCREMGFSAQIDIHVHSSDSKTFAAYNIPAIGISRVTKHAEIHTRNDLQTPLSKAEMKKIGGFSAAMIERIANAISIPFSRAVPASMRNELSAILTGTQNEAGE